MSNNEWPKRTFGCSHAIWTRCGLCRELNAEHDAAMPHAAPDPETPKLIQATIYFDSRGNFRIFAPHDLPPGTYNATLVLKE